MAARSVAPANSPDKPPWEIRKTNLNFEFCRKLANSIDNVTSTDILNVSMLNLHQWPKKNCPRELTYGWQEKLRKFIKRSHKRPPHTKGKFPSLHDYYMWSHLCEIGTQNRNNCNSWLDVSRFYNPLTTQLNNTTRRNGAKSRYRGLLVQLGEIDEDVTCTCDQHKLKLIYYTESTIGRQLLVGSTCILKEWFNCVLHYCQKKQWYTIDYLKQIYESVTKTQKQALGYIEGILHRLNNESYTTEIEYLIERCELGTDFINHALHTQKKRKMKKESLEKEFIDTICGMCILKNIKEQINDVNALPWPKPKKDDLIRKLKQICYEQECSEIKNLVPPIYLTNWYLPIPNKELTKIYEEDRIENYYNNNQDAYESLFNDNQLDNLYNLAQNLIIDLEGKINKKNRKEHIKKMKKEEKKMKKEEKEKKKADKLRKYNRVRYYHNIHITTYGAHTPVAGWSLDRNTNKWEKMGWLWKKRREWLQQYVQDEQYFCGDKYEVIKYRWVSRATHLTTILDDALDGKWNDDYVNRVLRQCDEDEYY